MLRPMLPGFVDLRFHDARPILQLASAHKLAPFRNQIGTIAALQSVTFLVDGARPARNRLDPIRF